MNNELHLENRVALITHYEKNKKVITADKKIVKRYYENELIRCIRAWRKRGGWLKNINIYVLVFNDQNINHLINIFKKYNVTCIYSNQVCDQIKTSKCQFLKEPFVGALFEKNEKIKEDIFIKIDLDMILLKPINKDIIQLANESIIIGQYSNLKNEQRISFQERGLLPFDTNIIILNKKYKFYQYYFDMMTSDDVLLNEEWKKIFIKSGYYFLDEFTIDYIYQQKKFEIVPIKNYQIGEGYEQICKTTNVKDIYFLHQHIINDCADAYDNFDYKKQIQIYIKSMCKINKMK